MTQPQFIILGCQKGGTTTLYDLVCRHPGVAPAREKEIQFFSLRYREGSRWYREQFPHRSSLITGEASPYYLFHPLAAERIARHCPEVRLLAVVRDPVQRALSHYFHARRLGLETLDLADALRAEPRRMAEAEPTIARGDANDSHRHHSYVSRSRYGHQLQRYAQLFPAEQLLVLRSEDLFTNPQRVMNQAWRHLGLDPVPVGPVHPRNRGGGEAAGVPVSTTARLEGLLGAERPVMEGWLARCGSRYSEKVPGP